jgi:hypothetical protein
MFAERFAVMINQVCSGPRYSGTELGRRKAKGKRHPCTKTSSLRNAVAVTSFPPPSQKRILEVNHTLWLSGYQYDSTSSNVRQITATVSCP